MSKKVPYALKPLNKYLKNMSKENQGRFKCQIIDFFRCGYCNGVFASHEYLVYIIFKDTVNGIWHTFAATNFQLENNKHALLMNSFSKFKDESYSIDRYKAEQSVRYY